MSAWREGEGERSGIVARYHGNRLHPHLSQLEEDVFQVVVCQLVEGAHGKSADMFVRKVAVQHLESRLERERERERDPPLVYSWQRDI